MVEKFKGIEEVKKMNKIFGDSGTSATFISYESMYNFAKDKIAIKIDFPSINTTESCDKLMEMVRKIFTRLKSAQINATDLQKNIPKLNNFLLKLTDTSLTEAQLQEVNKLYSTKFEKHIKASTINLRNVETFERALGHTVINSNQVTIEARNAIAKEARTFNTSFNKALEVINKENTTKGYDVRELTQQKNSLQILQTQLHELEQQNSHLARNCLTRFFNKRAIKNNRLEIRNLTEEIDVMKYDYKGFKKAPELARREYKEAQQQVAIKRM